MDETALALARLDQRLAAIEARIARVEEAAPALTAMAVDSLDDAARALAAAGIDLEARTRNALRSLDLASTDDATRALATLLERLPELAQLLAALDLGAFTRALLRAQQHGARPVGMLGLWRAFADAGVQRALGLAVAFAHHFGHSETTSSERLPTGEVRR